jgi:FKBP-type peptidyl-prolyl cis-trans isomerase
VLDGMPSVGTEPQAPVIVVTFMNYDDAECMRQWDILRSIQTSLGSARVRLVFRHLPSSVSSSQALGEFAQGVFVMGGAKAFAHLSERLFQSMGQVRSTVLIDQWAKDAGIPDVLALRKQVASGAFKAQLESDAAAAKALSVRSCPKSFANGRALGEGTEFRSAENYRALIEREIRHAETKLMGGTVRDALYGILLSENRNGEVDANSAPGAPLKPLSGGGLQIEDLVTGTGTQAARGDEVSVDYTGKLEDGTVFDSSQGRGVFKFVLGEKKVIQGWEQGLIGMRIGGKRKLVIPPSLAYGSRGAPPRIPANATLTFEVELRDVK